MDAYPLYLGFLLPGARPEVDQVKQHVAEPADRSDITQHHAAQNQGCKDHDRAAHAFAEVVCCCVCYLMRLLARIQYLSTGRDGVREYHHNCKAIVIATDG